MWARARAVVADAANLMGVQPRKRAGLVPRGRPKQGGKGGDTLSDYQIVTYVVDP